MHRFVFLLALLASSACYSLVAAEAAKFEWSEDVSQDSGTELARTLRRIHDPYTESRRDGILAKLCWEDTTLQTVYTNGDRNGANFRVLAELARRIGNNGIFVSQEARAMGQAQVDARLAGGFGRRGFGRSNHDGGSSLKISLRRSLDPG